MNIHNNMYWYLLKYSLKNKYTIRRTILMIISFVILICFEFYLLEAHANSLNILTNNLFKLFVILPSYFMTYIYWHSFKKNGEIYDLYRYIPIETLKASVFLNIYILFKITLPRMIYILFLPVYGYFTDKVTLISALQILVEFMLLIIIGQLICIVLDTNSKKILKLQIMVVLGLIIILDTSLLLILVSFLFIIYLQLCTKDIYMPLSNIKNLKQSKMKNPLFIIEIKKFMSEKPNILSYIFMIIFLFMINYNFSMMKNIEVENKYLLIIFIISALSPVHLLFSSDKELRRIAIYLPLDKKSIFISKYILSALSTQILLITSINISVILYKESVSLLHLKTIIIMLLSSFIRVKIDQYIPILNWNNKSDLWKNPRKYLSLLIILPIIIMTIYTPISFSLFFMVNFLIFTDKVLKRMKEDDFFG